MKKTLLLLYIIILIQIQLSGQLIPMSNQYLLNPMILNPAYSGVKGTLNFALFYRKQWIGVQGSPETLTVTADAPIVKDKVGFGFMVVRDQIGVTNETRIVSDYAYKISMGDALLSFGLGAGLTFTRTAFSDLVVLDPGDEVYLADSRRFIVPEVTAGLYYSYRNFFAGFSVPKLLTYKFDFNKNKYDISSDPGRYNYVFNTGILIGPAESFKFFPSVLLHYLPSEGLLFDVNAHFNVLKKFWIGASYRNNRSVSGLFQFQINNQLRAAYSYDYELGKLSHYSNGSHEIMLRYEFRYKANLTDPLIF